MGGVKQQPIDNINLLQVLLSEYSVTVTPQSLTNTTNELFMMLMLMNDLTLSSGLQVNVTQFVFGSVPLSSPSPASGCGV